LSSTSCKSIKERESPEVIAVRTIKLKEQFIGKIVIPGLKQELDEAQLEGVLSEFAHVIKDVQGFPEVVNMSIGIKTRSGVISQAFYRIPDYEGKSD